MTHRSWGNRGNQRRLCCIKERPKSRLVLIGGAGGGRGWGVPAFFSTGKPVLPGRRDQGPSGQAWGRCERPSTTCSAPGCPQLPPPEGALPSEPVRAAPRPRERGRGGKGLVSTPAPQGGPHTGRFSFASETFPGATSSTYARCYFYHSKARDPQPSVSRAPRTRSGCLGVSPKAKLPEENENPHTRSPLPAPGAGGNAGATHGS